jgi:hypothetical protein
MGAFAHPWLFSLEARQLFVRFGVCPKKTDFVFLFFSLIPGILIAVWCKCKPTPTCLGLKGLVVVVVECGANAGYM